MHGNFSPGGTTIAFIIREEVLLFATVILGSSSTGLNALFDLRAHATNACVLHKTRTSVSLFS
jgi:hypothetical protein